MTDELRKLAEEHRTTAEDRLASALAHALVSSSPVIDRFSSWVLGASGATAVLLVSSVSDLAAIIPHQKLAYASASLLASALFGFLAKARCFHIEAYLSGSKLAAEHADPIYDQNERFSDQLLEVANRLGVKIDPAINDDAVTEKLLKLFPPFPRWVVSSSFRRAKTREPISESLGSWVMQAVFTTIQSVLFVAFFFILLLLGLLT